MFTVQRLHGPRGAVASAACTSSTPGRRTFGDTTHRARAAAVRQIQAGHALRQLRQRARADRHVPLLRRRRACRTTCATYVKVPAISTGKRQIMTAKPTAGLQGLPAACSTSASRRSSSARDRPSPATTSCSRSSPTAAMPRSTCAWSMPDNDNEPDNKLNAAHRAMPSASGGRRRTAAYVRPDGKPFELPGAAPDDLLRSRHDQCREEPRLLGLSLDPGRAGPPGRAGLRNRLHAGLQEVRGQAAAVRRCSTPARSAS